MALQAHLSPGSDYLREAVQRALREAAKEEGTEEEGDAAWNGKRAKDFRFEIQSFNVKDELAK